MIQRDRSTDQRKQCAYFKAPCHDDERCDDCPREAAEADQADHDKWADYYQSQRES